MLFLTSPLFLFKRNSTLLPGTEVIVWDRLESPLVVILFHTIHLLSPKTIIWRQELYSTQLASSEPRSNKSTKKISQSTGAWFTCRHNHPMNLNTTIQSYFLSIQLKDQAHGIHYFLSLYYYFLFYHAKVIFIQLVELKSIYVDSHREQYPKSDFS